MWLIKNIQNALLGTIKPLFDELRKDFNQKFEVIDKRFEVIDKRFDKLDQHAVEVDRKLEDHNADIQELHEKVMGSLDGITASLRQLDMVKDHENRISTLEQDSTAVKAAIKNLKEV